MTQPVSTVRPVAPAWSPLRHTIFRSLWIAAVVSNVGTLMQGVGAAWFMTSLAPSPVMVSLVQAATTLPIFFLALPAGALADIIDRRKILLAAQIWMLLVAGLLGVLTLAGATTAWVLVILTFALGVGAALNAPAWQAIVLDIVPPSDLAPAVALNSAGFNIARTIGPPLGGLVLLASGPGQVFILNAISFLGVIVVLFTWRRKSSKSVLPAERVVGAMRTGLRYVVHAPALKSVLYQAAVFVVFATSIQTLLPLVARFELGRGPDTYGIILGFFGAGSVVGAAILPRLRQMMTIDTLALTLALLFSTVLFVFAFARIYWVLCVMMFIGGFCWLTLLSTFNASVQASVPLWVRGRAISVYLLIFFGGMAGGSAFWGMVAQFSSISVALALCGVGLVAGALLTHRFKLASVEPIDLAPSGDWPVPHLTSTVEIEGGAVMVTLEYLIDPANAREFIEAMHEVRTVRRRDGAIRWGLGQDITNPSRYVEVYLVESWVEHLRQHERLTVADRAVFDRARSFHISDKPLSVSHYVFRTDKDSRE